MDDSEKEGCQEDKKNCRAFNLAKGTGELLHSMKFEDLGHHEKMCKFYRQVPLYLKMKERFRHHTFLHFPFQIVTLWVEKRRYLFLFFDNHPPEEGNMKQTVTILTGSHADLLLIMKNKLKRKVAFLGAMSWAAE